MANIGDVFTTVEAGWRRIEDINSYVGYMGVLSLYSGKNSSVSANSYTFINSGKDPIDVARSYISFRFSGTKLRVYMYNATSASTYPGAILTIDGTEYIVRSDYLGAKTKLAFQTEELEDTIHTCFVRSLDSRRFNLDCFDIDADAKIYPAVGSIQSTTVDKTINRYPYAHPFIFYNNPTKWSATTTSPMMKYTKTIDDIYIEFKCYAKSIRIYDYSYSDRQREIDVYIDDKLDETVNSKREVTTRNNYCYYQKYFDTYDYHTIKLIPKETDKTFSISNIDVEGYLYNDKYIDISPIQISDTSPYNISMSSCIGSPYYAYKLFYGALLPSISATFANGTTNQWIQIDFEKITKVNTISFGNRNVANYKVPNNCILQGSNNGIDFNNLENFIWGDTGVWEYKYIEFNTTYEYRYYRIHVIDDTVPSTSDNTGNYIAMSYFRFMLKKNTKTYALKEDNTYKRYDILEDKFVETNVEELKSDIMINPNTSNIIDIINRSKDLPNTVIVSTNNTKINVTGYISNSGIIEFLNDFYVVKAQKISKLFSTFNIPEGCSIKMIVSIDDGINWKTYINDNWQNIEKTEAKILQDGIDLNVLESINFNTLNPKKINICLALQRDAEEKDVNLSSINWLYNELDKIRSLSDEKVQREISRNTLLIEPQENYDKIIVNVSTIGQN